MREDFAQEARTLFGNRYPPWVTARRSRPDLTSVPVFVFHSIHPRRFEAQLHYLDANGYRTLDTTEFLRFLKGDYSLSGPSVLLTIDDGRHSVWTHAFPLLKRYGMKATCFLIPGLIPDAEP
ncbi:MAG: polysaccharide deacetylase family protein, partial [Planctomycetota bacterium]